jgi:tripartite-type tricarboxylate transporter receptor subunit TctC
VQEKLKAQRLTPVPGTPEQFTDLLRSESARYARVIKEAGIRLD